MRIFYLSDLHLRDEREKNSQRLISFLKEKPQAGDTLILGGDIFDLFIGDKPYFRQKFSQILNAIQNISQKGCRVYYLEGNHDFHLNGIFDSQVNVEIMSDDFWIDMAGKKILVSHGDLIDEEDIGYRWLRRITRSFPLRILLKILPGSMIGGIGDWSSHKSRQYNDVEKISPERKERTRNLFKNFARQKIMDGADFVLIGHSHLRDQISIRVGERQGEYINLGFSSQTLLYGHWQADRNAFLIDQYS